MIRRLDNPVQHYAWGSATHIPRLRGTPSDGRPVAELWVGAHPADPSRDRADGRSLDTLVAADPDGILGAEVLAAFGPRLPFMVKLLAAARPLSLQVHPGSGRARRRYAEQEAAGPARDAPERTYRDPSHKPELLYALTRFEGWAGFRDVRSTARVLRGLGLPWLDDVADRLDKTDVAFQTLRGVVADWLGWTPAEARDRLTELADAAARAERAAHARPRLSRPPTTSPSDPEREAVRVYAAVVPLARQYPDDPSVAVTLLLNHVVLAPGEALYVAAGELHAYTSGLGVEIMATSDNVLRAGLTAKHVDHAELLEVTGFTPVPPPLWQAVPDEQPGVELLAPPVDEFALLVCRLAATPVTLDRPGPRVVLGIEGTTRLRAGDETATLGPGEAALVDAASGPLALSGSGRAVVGLVPGSTARAGERP